MVSYNRRALLKTAGVTATLGGLSSVDRYGAFARTASATTNTRVIDSFEDNDLSEYYGDTATFGVTDAASVDGSYALQNSGDGRANIYSNAGGGLDDYPVRGESFEFHVWVDSLNPDNFNQSIFFWGVQDDGHHYACRVKWHDGRLDLGKTEGDTPYDLDTASIPFDLQANTWYRIEVEWDDGDTFGGAAGDMTVTIHDANSDATATAAGNDTSWTDGGVGWATDRYNGETARYDYARIHVDDGGTIVDDFEDGDLDEYTAGDTGTWTITSDAYHGDHAAASASSSPQYLTSPEGGGLNYYPKQGDEFEFWIKCDTINPDNFNLGGILFGSRPNDDNYCWTARVRWHENRIQVRCKDDVNGTLSASAAEVDFTLQENTWYRCEVRWDDGETFDGQPGDVEMEIYNPAETASTIVAAYENSFASGGFGLQTDRYNGEVTTVDRVQLTGTNGGGGRDVDVIEDFETGSFDAYNEVVGQAKAFNFTDPSSDNEPIGGGPGYPNTVAQSAADFTVSTSSELRSATDGATSGDVIYVVDDIDTVGESTVEIPAGVTLASNRGIDGQPGQIIYLGKRHRGIVLREGCRFTGLRVEGPYPDRWSPDLDQENEYYPEWEQKGVNMVGDNCEVDNCELYGFGYSCLQNTDYDTSTNANDCHIHHNNVHHGVADGWGYGYDNSTGERNRVEYNRFAHCRHAITATGGSYETYHNIFEEPQASNVVDMHQPGGIYTDVRRNTIVSWQTDIDGQPTWVSSNDAVSGYIQRERPQQSAEIHDNWMWNPYPPVDPPHEGFAKHAIDQAWPETGYPGEWQDVNFSGNHYGGDTEPASTQRALDGRRCRDAGERCLAYYGSYAGHGYLSTSGLDNYPSAGDTWRFFFRPEGWPFRLCQVFFGVQDQTQTQDYYELEIREDEIALDVDVAGEDTRLGADSWNWKSMVPYEVEIDWPADPANDGITVTVTNWESGTQEASFTATADDTYVEGGIGFYGNSWSGFLLDDFEIL